MMNQKNESKKYFDRENNRLVFIEKKGDDPEFWDKHWEECKKKGLFVKSTRNFAVKLAKKFLKPNSRILEGGCGLGMNVYHLSKAGYNCFGIDNAQNTVKLVNKIYPELNIKFGDVRDLKFKNNFFDGYFSLGVIEHFYSGYNNIAEEISRVIKKEGYLFLTFPHMSFLRKLKASFGFYPIWNNKNKPKNFYQFVLNEKNVLKKLKGKGFILVEKHRIDGMGGIRRESNFFKKAFKKVRSNNYFSKIIMAFLDLFFVTFASHAILLILKKTDVSNEI